MSSNTDNEAARTGVVSDLRRFLVGPAHGPDERLYAGTMGTTKDGANRLRVVQTPYDFYHTGMLCPVDTKINEEEDEQEDQGSSVDSGAGDSVMVLANIAQQSAVGFTFQVMVPASELTFQARWGTYTLTEAPADGATALPQVLNVPDPDSEDASGAAMSAGKPTLVWQRREQQIEATLVPDAAPDGTVQELGCNDGVVLQLRRRVLRGLQFLTVSLVNTRRAQRTAVGQSDPRICQVRIDVIDKSGRRQFVESSNTARRADRDYWHQELLYRGVRQFAVGHGVAVAWDTAPSRSAEHIWTEWVPEFEVRKASALVPSFPDKIAVEQLADPKRNSDSMALLRALADRYDRWISERRENLSTTTSEYEPGVAGNLNAAAEKNLAACQRQRERIERGIAFLEFNPIAMEAFNLANAAMALSMKRARPEEQAQWFPFQIAFILMTLPSLSNPDDPERDVFDLIWFPTGGGKTEAYLGLSAFTLFYRGLTAETPARAAGTSIITRYTLRTLTVQQFERTVLAIMACEVVRRQHLRLITHEPFSVGLLVGSGATPKWLMKRYNDDVTSAEALLEHWGEDSRGRLLLIKKCPWCDGALDRGCLELETSPDRLITHCSNTKCAFAEGLPIAIVDEHLVNVPPSFVVATIDKFAQLAWEPALGRLLGVGSTGAPPDLIIQDELHLITDALGTVAGIYETAVDAIASRDGRGPKIIGATATIRRAEEQIEKLFHRRTLQFPPSGLDHDDSFFYSQDRDVPGRLYVGVHAQGRSPKHTLPRLMGGVLQSAASIPASPAKDSFWTLVCYFNSLRELGGALVIAEDDARAYREVLARETNAKARRAAQMVELTSHVPSYRIPEIMDQLRVGLHTNSADSEPIDILLATNMISVGVDIGRLGCMIIAGQPKTTAEYIQASSRVGRPRGAAGLVVIQYNWTRPRDRSHYERFLTYHGSFYRFVEATTVTPFAPRARDRALKGAVVSLARAVTRTFDENEISDAGALARTLKVSVRPVINSFMQRVRAIDPREADATEKDLAGLVAELEVFLARNPNKPKFWTSWRVERDDKEVGEFVLTSDEEQQHGLWSAMLSMRDTDSPTPVALAE